MLCYERKKKQIFKIISISWLVHDNKFGIIVYMEIMKLKQEARDGQVFEGWHEGVINFAPTYKYDLNSDSYYGTTHEHGRKGLLKKRAPAW